jgi:predicted RNase H-related nuclease YkuK (DUF458 family)
MSDSILDKQWRTMKKVLVPDVLQAVFDLNEEMDRVIHVGTDAQKHGKYMDYVTAVAVLNPGKGGRAFYCSTRDKIVDSLSHKLFTEVGLSLEIALALCDVVEADSIQVHVDANTNLKHDSAQFHQSLAGMVVGHGFKAVLKPDAWASSHVADHVVNHRNDTANQRRKIRKKNKRSGRK